jgi:hypothetical protein
MSGERPVGLTVERARVAARVKHHHNQESVDEARLDLKVAKLAQQIRETVDTWPPLSQAQREELAVILRTGRTVDLPDGGGLDAG